jgi:hypothetical protein
MIRSLAAAAMAVPLVLSACSSSVEDELAGETAADDAAGDGKADAAVDGAYTYFEVTADLRKCLSPVCGGYFMKRLNRSTTKCADGSYKPSCYVPSLDWSEAGLGDDQQAKLVDASNKDATLDGVYAIARGRFVSRTYPGHGNMGVFKVTEAWVAEGDGVSDGVFVKAKDNGIRCIVAPCPSTTEKALNTSRSANIAEIDFTAGGFSDKQIEGFSADLFTPSGILFAGDRYSVSPHGKGRTATAAYHRLADAPPGGN